MVTQPSIGEALVRTRRFLGVTQRELGERIGVTQPQIARWEANAYRTAALERVDAVARALGLTEDAQPAGIRLVAEEPVAYGATAPPRAMAPEPITPVRPARDLGEIVMRIRERGAELRERFTLRRIGVFGSFLTGEQTPDSDVDLLVELDEVTWANFMDAASFCEEILGRKVDFIRPDALRERLRERVLKEVLYVWEAR